MVDILLGIGADCKLQDASGFTGEHHADCAYKDSCSVAPAVVVVGHAHILHDDAHHVLLAAQHAAKKGGYDSIVKLLPDRDYQVLKAAKTQGQHSETTSMSCACDAHVQLL